MIAEAIAAIGALKSASDTAKSLIELRDVSLVREKAIELQSQIISIQNIALNARAQEEALIAKVRDLEKQIAQMKEWGAEKQAYTLTPVASGAFAYTRKPDAQPAEPPHWLCAKCFGNSHKSILQYAGRTLDKHYSIHTCHTCGGKIQTPWSVTPDSLGAIAVSW